MIKIGIIGSTGYAGGELARLLLQRDDVEINREQIAHARLVANPGCYPTCSTLSIYSLVKEGLIDTDTLIIDAKSGVSGT